MLENEMCSVDITSLDRMCIDSIELVKFARESAMKQVNVIQTMTYYCIGKWIVEEQQKGQKRAKYGKQILKQLSETLNAEFGRGFSVDTLENMRKFYLVYQDRISENLYRNFAVEKSEKASRILNDEKPFALSWSHYVKLMRIEDESARKFYEIESILFRNRDNVDLVFYNRLLKCFVLFDMKIGELKHQDLGQMQMYVNYYDRYEKTDEENPTIGVLLCNEKNDALVELTLPKDSNIYASKYQLYLPDKKLLEEKLQEWLQEEGEIGGE